MRKFSVWMLFLSLAFLLGALAAAVPLYRLALRKRPPVSFKAGGVPQPNSGPQTHTCKLAVVYWNDATVFLKENVDLDGPWTEKMAHQSTVGCVEIRNEGVLIVSNFADGKPDMFTLLPSTWVQHVTYLEAVKEEKNVEKTH